MRLTGLFLLALLVFLLIPFLWRDTPRPLVDGPSLEQFEFEEVTFQNGDLDLAGMLFLPGGTGPFPAVVVIHGSGTSRRDNPWYLTIVAELQSNEFAVLLPDKRGSKNQAEIGAIPASRNWRRIPRPRLSMLPVCPASMHPGSAWSAKAKADGSHRLSHRKHPVSYL